MVTWEKAIKRLTCEFPQAADVVLHVTVIQIGKKNLAAEEQGVTTKEHRLPGAAKEVTEHIVRVTWCGNDLHLIVAHLESFPVHQHTVYGAGRKFKVLGIDACPLGNIQTNGSFITSLQGLGTFGRSTYPQIKRFPQFPCAPPVVRGS